MYHKRSLLIGIVSLLIVAAVWTFVEPAAAGIILIIAATVILCLEISEDAAKHIHPEIVVSLKEDARTVLIENLGTAPAHSVRVSIIPDEFNYEIGTLNPDSNHQNQLPKMLREGKALVSWEKKDGTRVEKYFWLSGYAQEADPLRPVFPLFSWK